MIYPQMKILESKNCILRPIRLNDYKDLYEYYNNDKVVKFLPIKRHTSYTDTKSFIKVFFLDNYKKGKIGHYAIIYKKDKKVIGNMGFNNILPKSKRGEIGICLNPNYWGKGLSTELANLLIDYGFKELGLNYIFANIYKDNIYSKGVLERLNFVYKEDFNRKFINSGNKNIKCSKYILYRNDYF